MADLAVACRTVTAAADELGLRCALVGGFAVSVRTEPRFTRDVDLAVGVGGDSEAESLVHLLLDDGHSLVASVEQEAARRLAVARMELVDGRLVDLLFASSGVEAELIEAAEAAEVLPGFHVRSVSNYLTSN